MNRVMMSSAVIGAIALALGAFVTEHSMVESDSHAAGAASETRSAMMDVLNPPERRLPWTGHASTIMPGGLAAEFSVQALPRLAACFAEGTSQEVVQFYEQMLAGQAGPLAYQLGGRWPGAQGDPLTLTWSFMPDGVIIPAGVGEPSAANTLFATMNTQFAGNTALWIGLFEQSFARWGELTGVTYVRVTDGVNEWDDGAAWGSAGSATHGDVRISAKFIDGGAGSNVLAYNYFPGSGGDMVLDSSNSWTNSSDNYRFLRNVILHEHGHGLGMFHVCPAPTGMPPEPPGIRTKLMEPFLATNFDGPQHDDIRGGHRHYGDPFEPDNDAASAGDLGTLVHGLPLTVGDVPTQAVNHGAILSIDADGEVDYFAFDVDATLSVTVTIEPRGLTYDSSPQLSGSCTSGNFIDSLGAANLDVEILDSDGSTILAGANAMPAGAAESAYYPSLAPGSYYVRVLESDAPTQSQLYRMTLSAAPPTPFPAAAEPGNIRKNRYVSFSPNNPGIMAAFRVDKMTAPTGSCFVGAPDIQGTSRCLASPTFRVWSETTVHVGDCGIVPVATYQIRSTLDGSTFSPALVVETIPLPTNNSKFWGDVTGPFDGVVWPPPDQFSNVTDVLAILVRISNVAPVVLSFERANLQAVSSTDPCLNAFINTADLFIAVKAVAGDPYPFTTNPGSCPVCP